MGPFSVVVMILTVVSIAWFTYMVFKGAPEHQVEQDERAFFDEHGRWPDEPESAAVPRKGGYGGVDNLPGRS